jgi:hypothetical protein
MLLCLGLGHNKSNVPRQRRRKATKEERWVVREAQAASPTQKGHAA